MEQGRLGNTYIIAALVAAIVAVLLVPVSYWLGTRQTESQPPIITGGDTSWADVQAFGARPNDEGDDSDAIQRAIDSFREGDRQSQAKGGVVYFPKGHFRAAKPLVADGSVGLTLLGDGSQTPGYENPPASLLTYTGGGSGSFVSARSTSGFTVRNMAVRYNNREFRGDLFDFSHAEPFDRSPDSSYVLFDNTLIAGEYPVRSARSLISFLYVITSTVRNSHLGWAERGIDGKRAPQYGFSNAIRIEGNAFDNLSVGGITNPGQSWTIIGNAFEGLNIESGAAMNRAVYDELPEASPGDASLILGLKFSGNWLGDANLTIHDVWITSERSRFIGAEFSGNFFGGGNGAIRFNSYFEGISISGNYFESARAAIDLGPVAGNGLAITGNSLRAPVLIARDTNGTANLHVAGNSASG